MEKTPSENLPPIGCFNAIHCESAGCPFAADLRPVYGVYF